MDILYALRHDKHAQDRQLRYSLRSVHKFLSGVNDVFVIGTSAPSCDGTIHIMHADKWGPARNIMTKLQAFADRETLSDRFLYAGDDHFLLEERVAKEYPVYVNGTIPELMATMKNTYKVILANTVKALDKAGKNALNYNVHAPCIYSKEKLKELAKIHNLKDELGYVAKSLYFNTFPEEARAPVGLTDCKIRTNIPLEDMRARIAGRPVFSTGKEHLCPNVQILLDELYPEPSRWESRAYHAYHEK